MLLRLTNKTVAFITRSCIITLVFESADIFVLPFIVHHSFLSLIFKSMKKHRYISCQIFIEKGYIYKKLGSLKLTSIYEFNTPKYM